MGPERFWVLLAIAGLGGVIWGWNRSFVTPVLDQRLPHQLFDSMQARMDGILHDAQHLRELLATESADHSTERSMQRWALIQAALQTHEARYRALRHEHWAREVQLWLNQVEGFLAEQLPKLKKQNGATVLTHLEKLVATGEDLQKTGDGFVHLAAAPLQARTILRQCLAKAPEIVERVKDARVLAALDQPASAGPEEFAAGGMWLHWLQNAIPTIEFLPSEFTDDEESLRVRAELRMLRDGLDAPHPESLDQPQAMPSARADPAEA